MKVPDPHIRRAFSLHLPWYAFSPHAWSSHRLCRLLGPSFKRGPPKGYIHAIEQRWHQVESVLGAILASPDGDALQRVATYANEGLVHRMLNKYLPGLSDSLRLTNRLSSSDIILVRRLFPALLP